MSAPGSIAWFASYEARLAWRDWIWLMTRGRRRRAGAAALGFLAFILFVHGLAYLFLSRSTRLTGSADARELVVIAGMLALTFSAMLSQAMESVTRAFYARGDLELILTSPAATARLFAVRIAAITATILSMSLVFAAPFINMQAWLGGARWLCAYLAAVALSMFAVAVAVVIVGALFGVIGARRTRFISQILAAVIGAAFAIGLQFAAIVSFGTMVVPRFAVLERLAPGPDNAILWPARAVFGEPAALASLIGLGMVALAVVIGGFAPRFGRLALAAGSVSSGSVSYGAKKKGRGESRFRSASPAQALRRKEWSRNYPPPIFGHGFCGFRPGCRGLSERGLRP
jgi:ABC-2 type transport system permease protein